MITKIGGTARFIPAGSTGLVTADGDVFRNVGVKEYYPLDIGKMVSVDKVYYDRSLRNKAYFYLDFRQVPVLADDYDNHEDLRHINHRMS